MSLDPSIAVFEKHAKAYQEKYMDQTRYAEGLNRCCALIRDDRGRFLDLGCGPGNVSRYILDQMPHLKAEAIDLAPSMIDLAAINLPEAFCQVEDVRELKNRTGTYHLIVVGFCIPYLNWDEVKELLRAASEQLNEGGILYLSFMEGDYETSGYQYTSDGKDKAFIHYYPASEILDALQFSGFEIDTLLRTDFEKTNGSLDVDVQVVAIKKQGNNNKI